MIKPILCLTLLLSACGQSPSHIMGNLNAFSASEATNKQLLTVTTPANGDRKGVRSMVFINELSKVKLELTYGVVNGERSVTRGGIRYRDFNLSAQATLIEILALLNLRHKYPRGYKATEADFEFLTNYKNELIELVAQDCRKSNPFKCLKSSHALKEVFKEAEAYVRQN
jgi:hypothetical protein